MPEFLITSENSEDTFDVAHTLEEAVRIAKRVAHEVEDDDTICIEHKGKNIRQFVRSSNGQIVETVLI